MMDGMACCGPMMWGMVALGILLLVVLVLGAAALLKYLFGNRKK